MGLVGVIGIGVVLGGQRQPKIVENKPTVDTTATPLPTLTPEIFLGLVGDLGLGRHITSTARTKNNFGWSFVGMSEWLSKNDLNLANLESPITNPCPEGKTGTFTFCGDKRFVPVLSEYQWFFNLANNHIFNYGETGYQNTLDELATWAVVVNSHRQTEEFAVREINGVQLGFLGFDLITYPRYKHETILEKISKYDEQVDWLVVSIHWGNEYLPKSEAWRVELGHQMVEAGADIIHGHHPHVWQEEEVYRGRPIFYSLGNFVFDQSWSWETSHSQVVRLRLTKDKIVEMEKLPIEIKFNSQPWLMTE